MSPLVLVVDDEPAIRRTLAEHLSDEGYRVRCAADGREALEAAAAERPDVVVSDMRMPRLDGLELVEGLRAQGDRCPVVMISAHYAGADMPGVRFLPKPFDLDEVAEAVEASLAIAPHQGS